MPRHLCVLVVVVLLLTAVAASAQTSEVQTLRDQVRQLQDQLKQVMDRLQKIETQPAAQPVAKPAAPSKSAWAEKVSFSGYFHSRYEARENGIDDFAIRRLYFNMFANVNDRTTAVITLARYGGNDPNLFLDNCFINYRITPMWAVTFGNVPNTFGWDDAESSAKRMPFDRAVVVEGYSRAGLNGVYWKGPIDRGVYFTRKQDGDVPSMTFGVVNGNFNASDNDNNKTVSLDLRWQKPWGQFGASWLNGHYTGTDVQRGDIAPVAAVTTMRRAVGLYARTEPKPWGLQGEYVRGDLLGHEMAGWYGQVAYNTGVGIPYFRYENFEPRRELNITDDTYKGWRLGYEYKVDKNNELTLEYMDGKRLGADWGQLGLQWQLGF